MTVEPDAHRVERRWKLLAVLVAVAALCAWWAWKSRQDDPARHPARELRIELGQTVGDFMAANRLRDGPGGPREYTIPLDKKTDAGDLYFTDVWAAVRYVDGDFSLDLPPARLLAIGQSAGVITDFDAKLHAQPRPFAQADRMARAFIAERLRSGWRAQMLFYPRHEGDSNSTNNKKVYARMVSASGNELILSLMDLSQAPRFDVNIPGSASVTPSDPTPRFLMRVEIWMPEAARRRRDDYVNARRFATNGAGGERLGLRVWLDDPDWTPEQIGMTKVQVPNRYWDAKKPWLGRPVVERWRMPDGSIEP